MSVQRRHERLTVVSLLGYKINVREFVGPSGHQMGPNLEITVALRAAVGEPDKDGVRITFDSICSVLDALPNISGYEIVDGQGHGFVATVTVSLP